MAPPAPPPELDDELEPDVTWPTDQRVRPIPPERKEEPFFLRHPRLAGVLAAAGGPESSNRLERERERYQEQQTTEAERASKERLTLAEIRARAEQARNELARQEEAPELASDEALGEAIRRRRAAREEKESLEELSPGASLVERKTGKIRATAPPTPLRPEAPKTDQVATTVDQMKRRDFDLKKRQIEIKRKIEEGNAKGLTGPELNPLREEFRALQNERAQGWNRINQLRGTPQPPSPQEPSAEDARAIADLESRMTDQERRDWAGYTDAEKRYILKELRGAQ
jgi:chromosome segregation ATPase